MEVLNLKTSKALLSEEPNGMMICLERPEGFCRVCSEDCVWNGTKYNVGGANRGQAGLKIGRMGDWLPDCNASFAHPS